MPAVASTYAAATTAPSVTAAYATAPFTSSNGLRHLIASGVPAADGAAVVTAAAAAAGTAVASPSVTASQAAFTLSAGDAELPPTSPPLNDWSRVLSTGLLLREDGVQGAAGAGTA